MPAETIGFRPVTPDDCGRIYPYTSEYGEGSCQHSPVSMYSLEEKYGDMVCISGGFLYTLRSKKCDGIYRVYLAPLGNGDLKEAYERIFTDAASYGKKTMFLTLTEKHAEFVEKTFPGRFDITEDRDMAEYIYRARTMAEFAGGDLRKRRLEVHTFRNRYGDRAEIREITEKDFRECLEYEGKWLRDNIETHDEETLIRDQRMIEKHIAHYRELGLTGITLRIDGVIRGFCYGFRLGDTYDVITEKADRDIPHSFKVLRMESAKRCAADCQWVNMEEDVGLPGLRALKLAYKPEFLLRKFIVKEK